MGAETMALADQFLAHLFVVVNFTIESDANRAVFVVERLVSLLEVDDAQANMAEGERPIVEQGIARPIRPAVADRSAHPCDDFPGGLDTRRGYFPCIDQADLRQYGGLVPVDTLTGDLSVFKFHDHDEG